MNLNKTLIPTSYFKLFDFLAKNRIKNKDIDLRDIHSYLAMTLTTSVLMWAHAFLAYFAISSPVPSYIGFIFSSIHFLSPLLFRVTKNSFLITNIGLLTVIIHQGTFTYFTGGFMSHILIWHGLLPVLGGLVAGPKGGIFWFIVTSIISLCFLILHILNHPFPQLFSEEGRIWSHAMLVFGWIFLSSAIVVVYGSLKEHSETMLKKQGEKIDELFRVLFHDLANPLGRLSIGLSLAEKSIENPEENRGLKIAKSSTESMIKVTQNVRNIYVAKNGKAVHNLEPFRLNDSIKNLATVYSTQLQEKNLTLEYDYEKNEKLSLMAEPISFNNQVLGNALSNAIKFSHVGGKIEILITDTQDDYYKLQIKDHGIGIPSHLMQDLFEYNKRISRPGTLGEEGTGFGMQIMKSFVELYGGKVEVESAIDVGTAINIFLKGETR